MSKCNFKHFEFNYIDLPLELILKDFSVVFCLALPLEILLSPLGPCLWVNCRCKILGLHVFVGCQRASVVRNVFPQPMSFGAISNMFLWNLVSIRVAVRVTVMI